MVIRSTVCWSHMLRPELHATALPTHPCCSSGLASVSCSLTRAATDALRWSSCGPGNVGTLRQQTVRAHVATGGKNRAHRNDVFLRMARSSRREYYIRVVLSPPWGLCVIFFREFHDPDKQEQNIFWGGPPETSCGSPGCAILFLLLVATMAQCSAARRVCGTPACVGPWISLSRSLEAPASKLQSQGELQYSLL